jgi:pyridoxal phosphate enzyme (YggS family)
MNSDRLRDDPTRAIVDRVIRLKAELPDSVVVVAAAKTRSVAEVRAAIAGGVRIVGHNYVQEAAAMIEAFSEQPAGLSWQMIGHLQRNKVKAAIRLFDMIQTVDSIGLAEAIDRECAKIGRMIRVLIEVNCAHEPQKYGVDPEDVVDLAHELSRLSSLRLDGLMTMGPFDSDATELRRYFAETRRLFDELAACGIPNVRMHTLSMGMSDSYRIAVEEGATMVRLGSVLFGPRR